MFYFDRLTDEFAKIRLFINLEHISYWAVHHENKRYVMSPTASRLLFFGRLCVGLKVC